MSICEDLKVGGTVTGAGITGGTSVSDHALMVSDYSGLWGTVSKRATAQRSIGQAGGVITGKELPDSRLMLMNLRSTDMDSVGGTNTVQQLWDNQDTLTSLFTDSEGAVIEWILPSESRWIRAYNLIGVGAFILDKFRYLPLPLTAPWPYWQSDIEQHDYVDSPGEALAVGGTVERIYNPKLVFIDNGTFEDDTSGLSITVAGAAAPVTIERDTITGRWTALEGAAAVPGKVSVNDSRWMFLTRGGTVSADVGVHVYWRDQFE